MPGREHEAREALKRLRNTPHIEDDIDEMRAEEMAQQDESQINMLELLRSPSLRMPLTIAIVMQLSQQLSGINAVFYYSTNLFITTGLSETSAKYATIGIGTVMVLMTLMEQSWPAGGRASAQPCVHSCKPGTALSYVPLIRWT